MKSFLTYKRIIASLLIVSIVNGFTIPIVYANGLPVSDVVGNTLKSKDTIDNSVQTTNSTLNTIKEYGLDVMAQTIATYAGQKMANAIFNKANGGADGEQQPSFIQSFSDYFSQINDTETNKFMSQIKASGNPFADEIISSLRTTNQAIDDPNSLNSFSFDKITGVSLEDYTRDATTAGWIGYIGIALPGNNPYSAQIIAKTKLAQNKADALEREKTKLQSSGFTPQGVCTLTYKNFDAKMQEQKGRNATPSERAAYAQELVKNKDQLEKIAGLEAKVKEQEGIVKAAAIVLVEMKDSGSYSQTLIDAQRKRVTDAESELSKRKNALLAEKRSQYVTDFKSRSGSGGVADLTDDTIGCIEEIIKNPAALAGAAVNNAATYALDKAKNITGWGGLVTGVLLSMMGSFLKKGLSSLATDQAKRNKPVGGPEELITINGDSIPYNQAPNTIVDLSQLFIPAHKYTQLELDKLNDTLGEFVGSPNLTTIPSGDEIFRKQGLIDLTVTLDMCNPGPDIYWEERLKRTAESKFQEANGELVNGELVNQLNFMIETAIGETSILINDPQYNVPGSIIMTQTISQFKEFEQLYKKTREKIQDRSIAVGTLNTMVTELVGSIKPIRDTYGLKNRLGVAMPNPVFTEYHWNLLTDAEKKAYYQWAVNMTQ